MTDRIQCNGCDAPVPADDSAADSGQLFSIKAVGEPPRRSRYEAQAATASDPAAVAVAMNEALALFSRDIAGELEAVLQD